MEKLWKVAIVKDTSKKMLGLHGLQTACRGLKNVEVCAFVDPNFDNIEERMAFVEAKRHYTDMETMLQTERPDIVILTSRHPYDHVEQIRLCAKYGAHVYSEKSLVCEVEEGDEIIRIIQQSNIKVCVGHPCRYAEPYITVKKMIANGDIGDVVSFMARGKSDHRGGGEDMIVLGTHILDWLLDLFGTPETIFADITVDGKEATAQDLTDTVEPIGPAIGDHIYASFRFPGGITGSFETKKGLYVLKDGNTQMGLTIMGTKGSLSMRFEDFYERALQVCRRPVPPESNAPFEDFPIWDTRTVPGAAPLDYTVCQFKDSPAVHNFPESNRFAFYDLMQAIEEDRQPLSNAWNAVETQEMIQAIYLSHLTGRKVTLPLMDRRHPLLPPKKD